MTARVPRGAFGCLDSRPGPCKSARRSIFLRPMADKYFKLTDPATGKTSDLPLLKGTLGPDVLNIAAMMKDHGVFTFDPGYMATASCESRVTYIDGDQGVLLYRGYAVEQLAERSSFLEVAYLLLYGD